MEQEASGERPMSTMPSFCQSSPGVVVGGSGSGVVPPSSLVVGGVVGGSSRMLFTNAAWAVAVATYAGVPIPQAAPFVGVPLKCKSPNKPILDPYADRLFNAIQVMNLGNNRTRWHNTCQRAVLDTARNAGLRVEEGLVLSLIHI